LQCKEMSSVAVIVNNNHVMAIFQDKLD